MNFDGVYLIMYYSVPPKEEVANSGWNIGIARSENLIDCEVVGI